MLSKLTVCVGLMFLPACVGNFLPTTSGPTAQSGGAGSSNTSNGGAVNASAAASNAVGLTYVMDPVSVPSYTRKVKNLLTGLAATDAEIAAVQADPNALKQLIGQWQHLPEYRAKMVNFLALAFQQSQVEMAHFDDMGAQLETLGNGTLLLDNLRESFARTVLWLDDQGRPFNDAMTTQTFMMTTPLALLYIFLDQTVTNDQGQVVAQPSVPIVTFMTSFTNQDFNTWRPISVRQPMPGESTTPLGLADLANRNELVLHVPRQGFFSTPAFFAGCPTNTSNVNRVTMNQTMITALGHAFDGGVYSAPPSLAALDTQHAVPGTACYGCHVTMDPMRQFFRQAYTLHYSAQTDPAMQALPGVFAFGGISASGTHGIYDLGVQLSQHPMLAGAWVQKLCTYANDAPCVTTDPEFVRIAQDFAAHPSWSALVVNVFASPLVTHRNASVVSQQLLSFPVNKRDHLCPLLSNRLGIPDICGLDPAAIVGGDLLTVQTVAHILPADGYTRGAALPVLANDPTLFYRSALESMCTAAAQVVVDGNGARYTSADAGTAIAAIAHDLMNAGPDMQADVITILTNHYNAALSAGASGSDALRSTFVAACLSPAIAGMGQ